MGSRPSTGTSPLADALVGPVDLLADAGRAASAMAGGRRSGAKSCKDFASQAEAQAYFEAHGGNPVNNVDNLDRNRNGIACEVYPYGRSQAPVPTWVRSGVRSLLVTGLVGALGWAAGRHRRPIEAGSPGGRGPPRLRPGCWRGRSGQHAATTRAATCVDPVLGASPPIGDVDTPR